MSLRWGPKIEAKKAARRPSQSDNKRLKWEYQCDQCKGWFRGDETEVDHIVPCGSLKSFEDLGPFAERLFCEADGFRVLCKVKCHSKKTRSQS